MNFDNKFHFLRSMNQRTSIFFLHTFPLNSLSPMNIQQQIDRNREILRNKPTYANFALVWQPELLEKTLRIVYQSYDTGNSIQGVDSPLD